MLKLTGSHVNGQVQIIAIGSQILYRSKSVGSWRRRRRRLLLALGLLGAAYLSFTSKRSAARDS